MEKNTKIIIGLVGIFILILFIAPLMLVIFGGHAQQTPSCMFEEAGFICNEPVTPLLEGQTGIVHGQFQHVKDQGIILDSVAIVQGNVDKEAVKCWRNSGDLTISPRQPISFSDLTAENLKVCDKNGNEITPITDSRIHTNIWIKYYWADDTEKTTPLYSRAVAILPVEN